MSERWKPEIGDAYYFFDSDFNVTIAHYNGYTWDDTRIAMGNCFNTKDDAHAAAEKVKALLLSLQDSTNNLQVNIQNMVTNTCQAMDKGKENVAKATCNFGNLPKLTTEVFDLPDCPEWAKYAAVDKDGHGFYYRNKPKKKENKKWSLFGVGDYQHIGIFDASDWHNILVERPAKLPDWCKVGEWIYIFDMTSYFYCIITEIKDNRVYYRHGDRVTSTGFEYFAEYTKPARLRPYNADEMRSLVGKVVTTSSGRHCTLVTACKQEYSVIEPQVMLNKWLYATDLLHGGNTIDGKPCGALEHLENGEWVK